MLFSSRDSDESSSSKQEETKGKISTVESWSVKMSSKFQSFSKHRKLVIEVEETVPGSEIDGSIFLQVYEPASMRAKFFKDDEEDDIEWELDHSYLVENISIVSQDEKTCNFSAFDEKKKSKKDREVMFDSKDDAESFVTYITDFKKQLTEARLEGKLSPRKNYESNNEVHQNYVYDETETGSLLLIEIISIHNLAKIGRDIPDPYIIVNLNDENGKELHRTDYVTDQVDPIWTVKTKCLFLYEVKEDKKNEALFFNVKDFNALRKDKRLGHCNIEVATLLNNVDDQRISLELIPPPDKNDSNSSDPTKGKLLKRIVEKSERNNGILHLRSRKARIEDFEFMKKLNSKTTIQKSFSLVDELQFETEVKMKKGMFKSYQRKDSNGEITNLVRPGPDPQRVSETKYMTKKKINEECLLPSRTWVNAGTGKSTRLFVEILSCDGLPHMDQVGMNKEDKTDAFACLVFEDSVVTTDTIKDTLSPRWLPWTQRAFIFYPTSILSKLHIGVFDRDSGVREKLSGHDYIGRIAIENIANFDYNMDYVLKFNLRDSKMEENYMPLSPDSPLHSPNGVLTMRLRLECHNERQLLMSSLSMPEPVFVNMDSKRDFGLVHTVVYGDKDLVSYNLNTLTAWVTELIHYKTVTFYFMEGIKTLFLWRGTLPVSLYLPGVTPIDKFRRKVDNPNTCLCCTQTTIFFPIYSLLFFIAGITIVENPGLCIPYIFGGIFCFMLSLMSYQNSNPSPWRKSKTFSDYVLLLLTGKTPKSLDKIEPNENKEETFAHMKDIENRLLIAQQEAEAASVELMKKQEEQNKHNMLLNELSASTEIETKKNKSLTPFKSLLYPLQLHLETLVHTMRFTKGVLLWENSIFSFWITAGSFIMFCLTIFLPWGLIILWCMRVLVWVFLGPWMKLADIYYFKPLEELSHEEQVLQREAAKKRQHEAWDKILTKYKTSKEEAFKLRDMKITLFGEYIVNVPYFEREKFRDIPRYDSYASSANVKALSTSCKHVPIKGQHLKGAMIPVLEKPSDYGSFDKNKEIKISSADSNAEDSLSSALCNSIEVVKDKVIMIISSPKEKSDMNVPLVSPKNEPKTSYGGTDEDFEVV